MKNYLGGIGLPDGNAPALFRGAVATLAVTIAVFALLLFSGSANAFPAPDDDPFYDVPSGLAAVPNGTVLKSRRIVALALLAPLPVNAWQIQYKTLGGHNEPTADVTTIMVPMMPWLGRGKRPIVSYQTAEDALAQKFAPSFALRAGLTGGFSNPELESVLQAALMANNFAVVVPDYEGVHSQFLGAANTAHGVLDSLRAVRNFSAAGLSSSAPVGVWGYSGGAHASSVAAQIQPSYAPELSFTGIALGGLPADIKSSLNLVNGTVFGGLLILGFVGLDRSYPEANLRSYLNARGQKAVADSQNDSINDSVLKYPFLSIEDVQAAPGVVDLPAVTALMSSNSPSGIPGNPTAPVYNYHATADELSPIAPSRALMKRFCAAGVKVQHVETGGEHLTEVVLGVPGAIKYLADRFAGKAAPSNCVSIP